MRNAARLNHWRSVFGPPIRYFYGHRACRAITPDHVEPVCSTDAETRLHGRTDRFAISPNQEITGANAGLVSRTILYDIQKHPALDSVAIRDGAKRCMNRVDRRNAIADAEKSGVAAPQRGEQFADTSFKFLQAFRVFQGRSAGVQQRDPCTVILMRIAYVDMFRGHQRPDIVQDCLAVIPI